MKISHLAVSIAAIAVLAGCSGGQKAQAGATGVPATTEVTAAAKDPVTIWGNKAVSPDAKLPVVIDFSAVWCGPCRQFAPVYHKVAAEYAGKAIFLNVDVDNSPEPARQFEVQAIPQVSVMLPDGTVTSEFGYMDEGRLKQFLSTAGVKP